ncbi:MAG: ribonuclease E/G, partial [Polaromonas sp.]|nr:ribonuclease E/G [Polaromonas sp.]
PFANADAAAQPVTGQNGSPQNDEQRPPREPRERRSRDRYGRERRERGESNEGAERAERDQNGSETPALTDSKAANEATDQQIRVQAAPLFVAPAAQPAIPVQTVQSVAPAVKAPATPVASALPKVQSYDLPLQDLVQVAQGSGLQWVNSDSAKIAEAQAAIAMQAKPAHVPRERAPMVVSNEGPLVLVETKRDLADMQLPFEKPAA